MPRYCLGFLCTFVTLSVFALTPTDSVILGPGSTNMVFYRISDGVKTVVPNNDWHLAVTVRPTEFPNAPLGGTTIRYNEAFGVAVYVLPDKDTTQPIQFSIQSYPYWPKLHDSDSLLDMGAFNSVRTSDIFDFGWGYYNSVTHHVVGNKEFLIKLPNGKLKRFKVDKLLYDTAFVLIYSDINFANQQLITIRKKDFPGKNFVYLNLETNKILDKEPPRTEWDLLFLRYTAAKGSSREYEPEVGVWINKGWSAGRRANTSVLSNDFSGVPLSPSLSAVGWNWKIRTFNTGSRDAEQNWSYQIIDSLAYLLRKGDKNYKLVITGYNPSSEKISFFIEEFLANNVTETAAEAPIAVFPNPASYLLNIQIPDDQTTLKIFDSYGRMVFQELPAAGLYQLQVDSWLPGIYFICINNGISTYTQKVLLVR